MRSYWLKIVLGAVLIFAIGMGIRSAVTHVRHGVQYVSEGSGPISIPLFFVPFELNRQRVGTVRGLTVYRDSTREPSSVRVTIALGDSVTPAAFDSCIVSLLPEPGAGQGVNPTRFSCLKAGDTAGRKLVQFGTLHLRSSSDSFPLFAPADKVDEIKNNSVHNMTQVDAGQREVHDSIRAAVRVQIDSLQGLARDSANAIRERAMQQVDSLRQLMNDNP